MREIARSRALDRELAAELWPQSAQNPAKRPEIHNTDAENLDGTGSEGTNHPKMEGFLPCLPLNPHHPRADGDAVAAGFKKEIPFSFQFIIMNPLRTLILSCVFVLSSIFQPCRADPFTAEEIPVTGIAVPELAHVDDLIKECMESWQASACAVAIASSGKTVYYRNFGWSDRARTTTIHEEAMMRVGSLTKPLTAATVRKLLTLRGFTTSKKVFYHPTLSPSGILDLSAEPARDARVYDITVQHCIDHKSGLLDNDSDGPDDPTYQETVAAAALGVSSPPSSWNMVRWAIRDGPMQGDPGADYAYSNLGYQVLGEVVAELSGVSIRDAVYENVLRAQGVIISDYTMGRSLWEHRTSREPYYIASGDGDSVFDGVPGPLPLPYGTFAIESRHGQGATLTLPTTYLFFMKNYNMTSGAAVSGTPPNATHTGSLPGTNAVGRQRSDGRHFCVILNKRGEVDDGDDSDDEPDPYSIRIRDLMDDLIDGTTRWPTRDVLFAPEIEVSRAGTPLVLNETLDFGNVYVGATRAVAITIKNIGNDSLTGVRLGTSAVLPFRITRGLTSSVIPVGGSQVITVAYQPLAAGASGPVTLTIYSNDYETPSFTLSLIGQGVAPTAPTLTGLTHRFAAVGESFDLSVTAAGDPYPGLQWTKNIMPIPFAVNATHSIVNATLDHAGVYGVVARNIGGTVTSTARLGMIQLEDSLMGAAMNGVLTLTVPVRFPTGAVVSYQWTRNGTPLANVGRPPLRAIGGATTARLVITRVNALDAGNYVCEVTMDGLPRSSGTTNVVVLSSVPTVSSPGPQTWLVSETVNASFSATQRPVTFSITGLPAGVTYNHRTGQITGKPNGPGTGTARARATNAVGISTEVTMPWVVNALHPETVGVFNGLIARMDAPIAGFIGHGGVLDLTVAGTGLFSGKFSIDSIAYSFTGRLDASRTSDPTGSAVFARRAGALHLSFRISSAGRVTGQVSADSLSMALEAWRNPWTAVTRFSQAGYFTAGMFIENSMRGTAAHPEIPQGASWLVPNISITGAVTWSGKMADGASFTGGSRCGPNGQFPIHALLNSRIAFHSGSIHGWATAAAGTSGGLPTLDGRITWFKRAAFGPSYRDGIPLHNLDIIGGRYVPPVGVAVLGLTAPALGTANAELVFSEANIETADAVPAGDSSLTHGLRISTANVVSVLLPNPNGMTCSLAPTRGLISGRFTLTDSISTLPPITYRRTVDWSGVLVPRLTKGVGFFNLEQLLPGATSVPVLSGLVNLQPR